MNIVEKIDHFLMEEGDWKSAADKASGQSGDYLPKIKSLRAKKEDLLKKKDALVDKRKSTKEMAGKGPISDQIEKIDLLLADVSDKIRSLKKKYLE